MRSLWLGVLVCAAMLVACGDDDSDFAVRPSGNSSSSIKNVTPQSSDSETRVFSSSSVTLAIPCKTNYTDTCEYGELVDDRDGQIYRTVKIGGQWWMAENLNYEVDSSFCYNDSVEYCEKYGRLYMWATALGKPENECGMHYTCTLPSGNIQGVCPRGWHLPSRAEWETLFIAVGGQSSAAKGLKSTSGWIKYDGHIGDGSDSFGFSALPAGVRMSPRKFYNEGFAGEFWLSSENSGYFIAYCICLTSRFKDAIIDDLNKDTGLSVRCLKDDP